MKWAGYGAALGAAFLASLHAAADVTAVGVPAAVGLYTAFAGLCAGLAAGYGWAVRREREGLASGLRNGALCGAAMVMLRLAVFPERREVPLWFVTVYAAVVVTACTLGLGAIGAAVAATMSGPRRDG